MTRERRRALLSAADKTGIIELARGLHELSWELVATRGTEALVTASGLSVRPIRDHTSHGELFRGRLKTLDVRIFAGLLYRRGDEDDAATMQRHGFARIDLVACTFQPLSDETIDIGGPAMIRAAAKNHAGVIALVDPADYTPALAALQRDGELSAAERRRLAAKAFRYTEAYDRAIAESLEATV